MKKLINKSNNMQMKAAYISQYMTNVTTRNIINCGGKVQIPALVLTLQCNACGASQNNMHEKLVCFGPSGPASEVSALRLSLARL